MSDWSSFWIYGIIILIIGVITYFTVRGQKNEIRQTLEKKGAKNITVSWDPIDFDKSNHTYTVTYDDASGNRHNTSCKIHVFGSPIYWENEDR